MGARTTSILVYAAFSFTLIPYSNVYIYWSDALLLSLSIPIPITIIPHPEFLTATLFTRSKIPLFHPFASLQIPQQRHRLYLARERHIQCGPNGHSPFSYSSPQSANSRTRSSTLKTALLRPSPLPPRTPFQPLTPSAALTLARTMPTHKITPSSSKKTLSLALNPKHASQTLIPPFLRSTAPTSVSLLQESLGHSRNGQIILWRC